VMGHVNTVFERQLKHLVPQRTRSVYYMHGKFTRIVSKLFKFEKFELNIKGCIVHFESARNFFAWSKFVYRSIRTEYNIALFILCFKPPAAMLFIFQLQHLCSHPLFNNISLCICLEKQVDG